MSEISVTSAGPRDELHGLGAGKKRPGRGVAPA